ncbi:hypothetical protein AX16_000629 [Volvariella volvacea WC 439]|nr:hypothetical protein AX16_000629 [Volvariella volvacea WC 439]
MSTPGPAAASTSSRSRPQARRKPNDDASYNGPPIASGSGGTKRQAHDRVDGEPRVKRKRVEPPPVVAPSTSRRENDEGQKSSLVEFAKLPTSVLHAYLMSYDIVPLVYPSPLTANDPPPPSALDHPYRPPAPPSPPPLLTPANRPRRDPTGASRRRSSRLMDDDPYRGRQPVLADIDHVHTILAGIVERHFREMNSVREVDTLASFMCAVGKARGKAQAY